MKFRDVAGVMNSVIMAILFLFVSFCIYSAFTDNKQKENAKLPDCDAVKAEIKTEEMNIHNRFFFFLLSMMS